jgi:hypothetical protein
MKKQAKRPATFPTAQKWTTAKDRPTTRGKGKGHQKATTTKATQKAPKGKREEDSFLKAFQAKIKENLKAGRKPLERFTGAQVGLFLEKIIQRATEEAR